MLKPAILFEQALQQKNMENWHNQDDIYYSDYNYKIKISEDTWEQHQFVSLDKKSDIIGYITYKIDRVSMSINSFGIISYDKGNTQFIKDVIQVIDDIFYKYNFNRLEWFAYVNNPATRGRNQDDRRWNGRHSWRGCVPGCYCCCQGSTTQLRKRRKRLSTQADRQSIQKYSRGLTCHCLKNSIS